MMSKAIKFRNKDNEDIYPCPYMPVGSIYKSINNTNPSSWFGGTWFLINKNVIDTGWRDFTWTNSSYVGTSQSSYTQNKWRIKDNILYVQVGAGATAVINSGTEFEIARIPIKDNTSYNSSAKRVWTGAVGGSGATAGFILIQNSSYLSVHLKPHTSTYDYAAPWYAAHFTVPLDENFSFTTGSYDIEYTWKRTK